MFHLVKPIIFCSQDYQPAFYLDFPPGQGWKTKKSIAHKGEFCLEKLAVSQSYELLFILHVFTVRRPKSFFLLLFLEQELVLHQVSLALEGFAVLLLKKGGIEIVSLHLMVSHEWL